MGVEAKTQISRKEFGLTWSAPLEAGGVMIGDEVTITLEGLPLFEVVKLLADQTNLHYAIGDKTVTFKP